MNYAMPPNLVDDIAPFTLWICSSSDSNEAKTNISNVYEDKVLYLVLSLKNGLLSGIIKSHIHVDELCMPLNFADDKPHSH